ncbi:MAG: response regulator [Bdellovibrionaceae bacterium]|nr:response regulator [Pseudobdellovibrionaceae bacterium]
MKKRRINALDLIQRIEKLARERVTSQEVVAIDAYRTLKNRFNPKVILVIEDDENMQKLMARIFPDNEGFEVRMASDGTALTSILDEITPDIILMDIGLPWINGYELTELIKSHREMKHIPIVMVSGHTQEEDIKRAFQVGADEFIQKTFDIEQLKQTVTRLLKLQDR